MSEDVIQPPDGSPAVYWAASVKCWGCGRQVKCGPQGRVRKGLRRHWCHLHWLARLRWASFLDGWHDAWRFAAENRDDPLLIADGEDYGTGWAGHMRVGHITVTSDEGER